jgi:hypothetical protein
MVADLSRQADDGATMALLDDPAALADALERCRDSVPVRNQLGDLALQLMQRRRFHDALRVFDTIVELGDLEPAHYCNALWLVQRDNTQLEIDAARSRRYLAACLPHGAVNPAIHLNAAAVYAELDEPGEAIAQLLLARDRGIDVAPFLGEPLFARLTTHPRWSELGSVAPPSAPTTRASGPVPAWATVLDEAEYAAFRGLIDDHLRDWFLPHHRHALDDGRVDIKLGIVREVRRFELEPLARQCHRSPRAQWPVHISEWLRWAAGPPTPVPPPPPAVEVPADSLEPETEQFLLQYVPGLAESWRGATPEEIDELEHRIERPLPRFYRWFLGKMGHDMGPLRWPRTDFSIGAVLEAADSGDPNLMIGIHDEDIMPLDLYYDLDQPARDDAMVWNASGGPEAETFRERLWWSWVLRFRIAHMPSQRIAHIKGEDALALLAGAMERLGFVQPIRTGRRHAIFARADAAMVVRASSDDSPLLMFHLGTRDETDMQRILRAIEALERGLDVTAIQL